MAPEFSDEFLEKVRRQNENAFHALDEYNREEGPAPVSLALGAFEQIYDKCGMMGLCQECRRKGITTLHGGCGSWYVAGRVRGQPDECHS